MPVRVVKAGQGKIIQRFITFGEKKEKIVEWKIDGQKSLGMRDIALLGERGK